MYKGCTPFAHLYYCNIYTNLVSKKLKLPNSLTPKDDDSLFFSKALASKPLFLG